MKLNDKDIAGIRFLATDPMTRQKFGAQYMCNDNDIKRGKLPDIIEFDSLEELEYTATSLVELVDRIKEYREVHRERCSFL